VKVSQFLKEEGLKHFTPLEKPEGFKELPLVKEGVHRVQFFLKEEGERKRCLFNSSKRCKKLLALAELACREIEEGGVPTEEKLVGFFTEEKDKGKLKERAKLILRALQNDL
jgi:hypothetical protein